MALVNLYSDTQTRPTSAMRTAMAEAEVGDEQRFEDPQVTELCSRVAALLGMEAAVFLPSGTMCNEIAFRLHIRPGGDEAILHRRSHPIIAEAGGPAAFAGAMMYPLDTPLGMFTGEDVRRALRRPGDRYAPRSRLVCVEQTTNMSGGRVWPLEQLRDVVEAARDAGLRLHMDGARLMNAVVASGVPAAEMTRGFDTAWLDFTKGLGAPLGAVLAGSAELIDEAWRYKQMLGGALRQAGIVAAGALYALDHHVDRLAEDHARARRLAEGLAALPGVTIDPSTVETNIVIFEHDDPGGLCAKLEAHEVRMGAVGPRQVRAVTHLDVDDDGIQRALDALERVSAR
ncbi:threonine aldolase family protein [Solirubrobacter deserti]|uniref:Aminotransferase class I/II-fold pyridoxal phosphate-dependent enzyme n=1 Tax=Solirubrobacter deserti TaxID=2282478 RepID=A0ABT4RUV2_9ACTN|nr:GntG family PLP-dependent aldolase [Solirubrobacter deserti]MDA0142359.1 aminotransferase class I/II-fold pyridoxal phosphate-dependent enzyme [Solirubrobacter deserti]